MAFLRQARKPCLTPDELLIIVSSEGLPDARIGLCYGKSVRELRGKPWWVLSRKRNVFVGTCCKPDRPESGDGDANEEDSPTHRPRFHCGKPEVTNRWGASFSRYCAIFST